MILLALCMISSTQHASPLQLRTTPGILLLTKHDDARVMLC